MWTSTLQNIAPNTAKFTMLDNSRTLTFREVIDLWSENVTFGSFFTSLIKDHPFEAFFWECPPVTRQTLDKAFEFVLVESQALSQLRPDPTTFKAQFAKHKSENVIAFPNLGGDAMLIVPASIAEPQFYTHFARFIRNAPAPQVERFWQIVGLQMEKRISDEPTWLSTAGMGVSWLHVRLDSYPKYYRHEPYKRFG